MIRPSLKSLVALGVLLLLAGAAGSRDVSAADRDGKGGPFRIYVATWRGCEETCRGFLDYVRATKIPAEFILRNAEQNKDKLPEFVREARRMAVDLVVTWGGTVTLEMIGPYDAVDPSRHLTDLPVVFMYVPQMVESKVAPNLNSTGRANVAGTDYSVPIESQLSAITSYRPIKTLGVVFDSTQLESVQRLGAVTAAAAKVGIKVVSAPVPLNENGAPDPARLDDAVAGIKRDGAEFVYFGFSSFLITNVKRFAESAVARGLPVFTSGELPLVQGDALLGLYPSLQAIGQLAGFQAEKILMEHREPGDLPIARFNRYLMAVNMRVAKKLELYPPLSMISYIEMLK